MCITHPRLTSTPAGLKSIQNSVIAECAPVTYGAHGYTAKQRVRPALAFPKIYLLNLPAAVDQHAESAQDRRGPRIRTLGRSRVGRVEVGSVHEETVRLGVESHGFGPELSIDGVDFAVLIGRVFVEDVDLAFVRGDKDHLGRGIVGDGVGPGGDGKGLDDLSAVRIHDHQDLRIAAGAEKPPVLAIHGQRRGTARRRGGPLAI